jgi:hypothetical protein
MVHVAVWSHHHFEHNRGRYSHDQRPAHAGASMGPMMVRDRGVACRRVSPRNVPAPDFSTPHSTAPCGSVSLEAAMTGRPQCDIFDRH